MHTRWQTHALRDRLAGSSVCGATPITVAVSLQETEWCSCRYLIECITSCTGRSLCLHPRLACGWRSVERRLDSLGPPLTRDDQTGKLPKMMPAKLARSGNCDSQLSGRSRVAAPDSHPWTRHAAPALSPPRRPCAPSVSTRAPADIDCAEPRSLHCTQMSVGITMLCCTPLS